jgi:hypothetical protein
MANSTAVPVPCPVGYCNWSRAVFRTLSWVTFDVREGLAFIGAKAAT